MGQLKPNTKYVYESPDNGETIYAREVGSADRTLVGYSYSKLKRIEEEKQIKLWNEILKKSEENKSLKHAIDNVILIYNLIKESEADNFYDSHI